MYGELLILNPGPGVEIDDAGLRLIECSGYVRWTPPEIRREKPAGVYIERFDQGKWQPIEGPFWGGPIGGYPPEAENRLRQLLAAV